MSLVLKDMLGTGEYRLMQAGVMNPKTEEVLLDQSADVVADARHQGVDDGQRRTDEEQGDHQPQAHEEIEIDHPLNAATSKIGRALCRERV